MKKATTRIPNLVLLASAFGLLGACVAESGSRDAESGSPELGVAQEKIIYGNDDRREIGTLTDPRQIAWANATGVFFDDSDVTCSGGSCALTTTAFGDTQGGVYAPMCPSEPFLGQPQGAHCTGFLIAPDLVVSAGHCYNSSYYCDHRPLVFGFTVNASGQATTTVPESDVYHCASIVAQGVTYDSVDGLGDVDFALLKLDRPVTGRTPLAIRQSGLVPDNAQLTAIGSPLGIPLKYAGGAFIRSNLPQNPKFALNLDASAGMSGAPVIDVNTGLVEGIVSAGPGREFVDGTMPDGTYCQRTTHCDDTIGCQNQAAWVKAARIKSVVEALEGRSCWDRTRNGQESDIDCGGPDCRGCMIGQACNQPTDCFKLFPGDCRRADCNQGKCAMDYSACECAVDSDCNDGIACTVDYCTGTYACAHDSSACPPPCTEANAIDIGSNANTVTVPNNACLRVRDHYPTWWGKRTMQLMSWGQGAYPVPFNWSNTCAASSGSGTFTASWQNQFLNQTSAACATLIDLKGNGSGNISLVYY